MLAGLTMFRERAEAQAVEAINWYYGKKKSKNYWSRLLRFWTILLTVLGGLVPILAATGLVGLFLQATGHPAKSDEELRLAELHFNQLGYVLIGLAAACVAFDRFFGFSTNWMRYIGAAMRMETARVRFRFEWETLVAPMMGKEPGEERIRELLEAIQKFSLAIREAIEQETGAWIAEFQTNLSQLDKETKALFEGAENEKKAVEQKAEARKTGMTQESGSIEVRIANFQDLEGAWAVSVDNSPRMENITGDSALLKPFEAGHYHVSATGRSHGATVRGSDSVELKPGTICKIALTLQ